MRIGRVLVAGQRVADQDGVGPIRVEPAVGLIGDRERAEIDPAIQPQGLAHKQTVTGPVLVRTRAEARGDQGRHEMSLNQCGWQRPAAAGAAGSRLGALARDLGSGMSTFSLILPGRDPTSTRPAAANEAMSSTPSDLTGLRRRLDEIDDRLQDLLIERAEIVSMVAASKRDGNQPAFQPAREAEIIRRLVGRHRGAFPVATLVRMWREMLAATVRLAIPFFGRGIRARRSAGVLGSGAGPLRQQHADGGL